MWEIGFKQINYLIIRLMVTLSDMTNGIFHIITSG